MDQKSFLTSVKKMFGKKKEIGDQPTVYEMQLGEKANFKWNTEKKRWEFPDDVDNQEEEIKPPPITSKLTPEEV